jgi:hypothetical protein
MESWQFGGRLHEDHPESTFRLLLSIRRPPPRYDGGVPERFLLDFDVGTYSTQQARVGMPKRVPANFADAGTCSCRFDVLSQNALLSPKCDGS